MHRLVGSRLGRGIAAILLAVLTIGGVMAVDVLDAEPASATSTKCAYYGTGIKWGVRNGSFCDTVHGSRAYVSQVTGNFGTTISGLDVICNPSMKIDVYDRYGNWKAWRQGPQRTGCFYAAFNYVPTINVYYDFWYARCGYARVTLQSYGRSIVANYHGLGC